MSACSEKSLLNEPESKSEVSFLQIPAASERLAKTVEFSSVIDGSIGGQIYINHSYVTSDGKSVQISGSLEIPAQAFTGIKNICISLDDEYALINFSPSPYQFSLPLKLNLQYRGVNLDGIDDDKTNFYYVNDEGNKFELIKTQSKIFNRFSGTIGIIKAEINHFSRFGWVI